MPILFLIILTGFISQLMAESFYENDFNIRVEAGSRTCFFEKGKAGQMMEVYYQVLDGQHGDLDIIFEFLDPEGAVLVSDYKKSQNSLIFDLALDGDYAYCMDNTFSMINSKLVYVSVTIEDKQIGSEQEAPVSVVEEGVEIKEEILEWTGVDSKGETYYIEVDKIAESLVRTLQHVVKARKLLDMYGAMKTRDSYLAFEDTFIVDIWSGFQISFMLLVGMLQVYMIKKLFSKPNYAIKSIY